MKECGSTMLKKPDQCSGCPLYKDGIGYAPGEGPIDSNIVLIGEALGYNEAMAGRPFVGGTGKMLRSMLRQADILPESIYITNTVKCQPPGNRTPTKEEITYCTNRYLWGELDVIKPNIIITAGATPFKAICTDIKTGVTKARGYIFPHNRGKILPIVHPSFVARGNPEFWSITVVDLIKAKREAASREVSEYKERFIINPNIHDVRRITKHILDTGCRYSFDIETIGEGDSLNVMCIGFAWSDSDAICIPLLKRGGYEYWNGPEEIEVVGLIAELLDSPNIKITQNGFTFDLPVLMDLGFKVRPPVEDTLIKHHVVATELPHSLEFLTSIYTPFHHYKGVRVTIWADDTELREYNCRDCIATYIANDGIEEEMKELSLI